MSKIRLLLTGSAMALGFGLTAAPAQAQVACDLNGVAQTPPVGTNSMYCGSVAADFGGADRTLVGQGTLNAGDENTAVGSNVFTVSDPFIGLNGPTSFGYIPPASLGATAIGSYAYAIGNGSVAVGDQAGVGTATIPGDGSFLFGNIDNGTAIGSHATVTANGGTALGSAASSAGTDAIAIGNAAVADFDNTVNIGSGNDVQSANSVAIGTGQVANGSGAVAIGDPNTAIGTGAVAIGADNTATGDGAVALGNLNTATGNGAVAIGLSSDAAAGAVALGDTANSATALSVAIGSSTSATGTESMALGSLSNAGDLHATAVGAFQASATGEESTAIGSHTLASGVSSFAGGVGAIASGDSSVALGENSVADGTNSVAIGTGSSNGGFAGSVALGNGTTNTAANQVAVGGRVVTQAANATLSATSTDLVTGQQLFATNQAIAAISVNTVGLQTQIDDLFGTQRHDRREARRGTAAAVAMSEAPMPSRDGGISYSLHGAAYRGEFAVGGSLKYRISQALALDAGVSHAGHNDTAVRAGISGEF